MEDSVINELLEKLDEIALSYSEYDFGLPKDENALDKMRSEIREWFKKNSDI
jgi:hypothetical protein